MFEHSRRIVTTDVTEKMIILWAQDPNSVSSSLFHGLRDDKLIIKFERIIEIVPRVRETKIPKYLVNDSANDLYNP